MRKALMAAQRMADDLVKDAERKKEEMLAQAEASVRSRKAELAKELESEEYRLQKAQQATNTFVSRVRALHAKEAEYLSQLEELCPPETRTHEETVDETASEIDDNVQRLLAQAMEAATAENLRSQAAEEKPDLSDTAEFTPGLPPEDGAAQPADPEDGEDDPSSGRIDFGALQFGRDYEIT